MTSFAADSRYAILLYFWRTIRAAAMGSAVVSMAVHGCSASLAVIDCGSLRSTALTWPVMILIYATSVHPVRERIKSYLVHFARSSKAGNITNWELADVIWQIMDTGACETQKEQK